MSLCKLCKCPGCAVRGSEYDFASCPSYEPMNHADRLRAMTDAELAEFLAEYRCTNKAPHCMEANCAQCWLEWLRQEAEE